MSLRVRQDGRVFCAAMHPEELGDTYLRDIADFCEERTRAHKASHEMGDDVR